VKANKNPLLLFEHLRRKFHIPMDELMNKDAVPRLFERTGETPRGKTYSLYGSAASSDPFFELFRELADDCQDGFPGRDH
jgi:hypothetical protein